MIVTYLGHAALMVEAGGAKLLMDPWLEDPAYCDSWWHYPPLALGVEDLGRVDFVFCSHEHPDHFDPKTLRKLPRDTTFLVPDFTSATLQKRYRELGFENLVMLEFGVETELAEGLSVVCYRTDLVWEDSSLVVKTDDANLFNQNDCKLSAATLDEIAADHPIDIAFLPFSGAIQFPTCYAMSEDRKRELCESRRKQHLSMLIDRTKALKPRHVVPFAGNFALFAPDQLWMNEVNNINPPSEAIDELHAHAPEVDAVQMNPGDTWSVVEGHVPLKPAPDWSRRLEHIRELAAAQADRIATLRAAEPPARPSLRADFERYFTERAAWHPELPGRIAATVVFDVEGDHGGVWTLRFTDAGLAIADEDPADWNLRVTIPGGILQRLLDDEIVWDEALISFRLRFAENPEFFNEPFWLMLYAPGESLVREYFELARPLAPSAG